MSFSAIPLRINGDEFVEASWWNDLRTAGINVDNFIAALFPWTSFAVANNISVFTNVTGALIDPTLYQSAEVDIVVMRVDDSPTKKYERSKYLAISDGSSFTDFVPLGQANDSGCTFNLTSAGQLQYKSGNLTGTISLSKLQYRISTSGLIS